MLIGLGFRKRNGKSVSSRYLVENYGFIEFAFATRLKQMIDALHDIPAYYKVTAKESIIPSLGKSYRSLCEEYGQGMRTLFGAKYWVNLLKTDIKGANKEKIVVSDVRHMSEVSFIKEQGGILINITNPRIEPDTKHISEQQLINYDKWDYVVINDGTKEELYKKLDILLKELI